jgi:hypothetical protein
MDAKRRSSSAIETFHGVQDSGSAEVIILHWLGGVRHSSFGISGAGQHARESYPARMVHFPGTKHAPGKSGEASYSTGPRKIATPGRRVHVFPISPGALVDTGLTLAFMGFLLPPHHFEFYSNRKLLDNRRNIFSISKFAAYLSLWGILSSTK